MKKTLFLVIAFLISISSYAAHYSGYEFSIVNVLDQNGVRTNNFKFQLKFYIEPLNGSMPTSFSIKITEKGSSTIVSTQTLTKLNTNTALTFPNSNCYPNSIPNGTVFGTFLSPDIDVSIFSNPVGYVAFTDYCCGADLNNVSSFSSLNILLKMEFPALNSSSIYKNNSSPIFTEIPRYLYCLNKPAVLNCNATDLEGDLLKYYIGKPQDENGADIQFAPGYTAANPIGTLKDFTIDSLTGKVTFTPTVIGRFYIPVRVMEYRNGVKIGELRRELVIQTDKPCAEDYPPVVRMETTGSDFLMDTVEYGQTAFYPVEVLDDLSMNDSLYFTVIPDPTSEIDYTSIDPVKVSWTQLSMTGTPLSTQLGVPAFWGKTRMKFRFKFITDNTIPFNKTLKFKGVVNDIGCSGVYFSDTLYFQIYVKKSESIITQPSSMTVNKNEDAKMYVKLSTSEGSIKWQAKTVFGFADIAPSNKYTLSGPLNDTLVIKNLGFQDHAQAYRCIAKFNVNMDFDTSAIAYTYLTDTNIVTIYDTIHVIINDTVTVTDTLLIKLYTSTNPSGAFNVVKIYPNPASTHITIDAGDLSMMQDYTIKIYSSIAQLLYQDKFTKAVHQIDLRTWPGPGTYFVNISNKEGVVVESKKIVIQ